MSQPSAKRRRAELGVPVGSVTRALEGKVVCVGGKLDAASSVTPLLVAALSTATDSTLVAFVSADGLAVDLGDEVLAIVGTPWIRVGSLESRDPAHHGSGMQLRALRRGDVVRVRGELRTAPGAGRSYRRNALGWALAGAGDWDTVDIAFEGEPAAIDDAVADALLAQVHGEWARRIDDYRPPPRPSEPRSTPDWLMHLVQRKRDRRRE
jgi:hypothetical protein